jgi:hypothetical protein
VKILKTLDALKDEVKSQDPIDSAAAELGVANIIASYADARKTRAKAAVEEVIGDKIAETKAAATKYKSKQAAQAAGAERIIVITCNAPAQRLDAEQFANNLIKAGIKKEIVDDCRDRAYKSSSPATSFTVADARDAFGK